MSAVQEGIECLLVLGPPGCGKTGFCRRFVEAANAGDDSGKTACLCAHSAMIAATIGGRTLARHLNYGKWAPAPARQYVDGASAAVAAFNYIVLEEAQAAGVHTCVDVSERALTACRQVRCVDASGIALKYVCLL